jgi:Cu/Ag efflux protein CusF
MLPGVGTSGLAAAIDHNLVLLRNPHEALGGTRMRQVKFTVPFLVVFTLAAPVALAQMTGHDHSAMGQMSSGSPAKDATAVGEVQKVDHAKGTVTLKHGPLNMLGMGPMTMMFQATNPRILANVKVGDKVRFIPEQRDGNLMVSHVEVMKN